MRKCLMLASFIPALMGGCPPPEPTDGIDLGVRGEVYLEISRDFGKASADLSANVIDRGAGFLVYQMLELSPSQVFRVNGVPLSHGFFDIPSWVSATIPSLTPPGFYTIEFDNNGTVSQMQAPAVSETSFTAPAAGAAVSKSGFVINWSPFNEPDMLVNISIEGDIPDPDRPGTTMRSITSLDDRADTGGYSIDSDFLMKFLPGTLEVTISRHQKKPQELGFASGQVVVKSTDRRSFTLTD